MTVIVIYSRISPHKSPLKDRRGDQDREREKIRDRSPIGDKKKISAPTNDKAKSKEKHER